MTPVTERRLAARRAFITLCLLLLLAAAGGEAWAGSSAAEAWLDKMMHASRTLNYDGVFVYQSGTKMQSMRIIHRAGEQGERERLVALSGSPREVIRDNGHVTCIIPDTHSVVVAKSRSQSLLPTSISVPTEALARYYTLSAEKGQRVAGYRTELIVVKPRDRYRYGYRLSLERDTGFLLKSAVVNADGATIEQMVYTNVSFPETIPDALLKPSISGEGYTWYSAEGPTGSRGRESASDEDQSKWHVAWLPEGFVLSARDNDPIPTSRMPVEQFVYSDGVASLSVFVERLESHADALRGASKMGAMNAYGRVIDGFQVTVFGELPARTVAKVAASITRD